ncbi:MAG: hypothetical protein ACI9S8_002513 [Chlamydiales bacterium]|jgi:hypothetical protein
MAFGDQMRSNLKKMMSELRNELVADMKGRDVREFITGRSAKSYGSSLVASMEESSNTNVYRTNPTRSNYVNPVAELLSPFRSEPESIAHGIYELENDITFNVLDQVVVDQETGGVTLLGHFDPRYKGRGIPYYQHLAVLLDHPRPRFTLDWTPESERAVEALLSRLDDPRKMARLASPPIPQNSKKMGQELTGNLERETIGI